MLDNEKLGLVEGGSAHGREVEWDGLKCPFHLVIP